MVGTLKPRKGQAQALEGIETLDFGLHLIEATHHRPRHLSFL